MLGLLGAGRATSALSANALSRRPTSARTSSLSAAVGTASSRPGGRYRGRRGTSPCQLRIASRGCSCWPGAAVCRVDRPTGQFRGFPLVVAGAALTVRLMTDPDSEDAGPSASSAWHGRAEPSGDRPRDPTPPSLARGDVRSDRRLLRRWTGQAQPLPDGNASRDDPHQRRRSGCRGRSGLDLDAGSTLHPSGRSFLAVAWNSSTKEEDDHDGAIDRRSGDSRPGS